MSSRHFIPSRKRVIAVAALITLTVLLTALSLREKKLKIAIHQNVEGVALKQIVAKFAQERNFSVEVVELPYDQLYEAELETVMGTKEHGFDVVMLDDPWMPALMDVENAGDRPKLMPLEIPAARVEDFVASTLAVARNPVAPVGNTFYAVPFVGNSQLFMRRRGSERSFGDWAEVINGGYIMRVGKGNQIVTDFVPMVWAASEKGFRDQSVTFSDEALGAFQLLAKLGSKGNPNLSIISQDDFDLAIQLQRKRASSSIIWSAWAMAMARLPEPQRTEFFADLEFAPMPGGQTVLGAWLLAIPQNSAHPDQARDFINFATAKEQIIEAARAGNPPPLKSVLMFDIAREEKDPILKKQQEQADAAFKQQFKDTFAEQLKSLEAARPRPRTRHWKKIETAVGNCLSRLYESAILPDQALKGSNDAIAAITSGENTPAESCRVAESRRNKP